MSDEEPLFAAEEDESVPARRATPWKILVVDDDRQVFLVTRLSLRDVTFLDRPLDFLYARSGAEGARILAEQADIAVILLDVVMETEDAGLRLVHHIRQDLGNRLVRIILRTGQPGAAPEKAVIAEYDINDYKAKTELTETRLYTSVISALRAYRDLVAVEASRRGLRQIIDATSSLFQARSMQLFASGVLTQLAGMLDARTGGILCCGSDPEASGGTVRVLAASGRFETQRFRSGHDLDGAVRGRITAALAQQASQFAADHAVLYLRTPSAHDVVVYVESEDDLAEVDRSLIEVFGANIAVGFDNLDMYEQLVEAKERLEQRVEERTRALWEREVSLRKVKAAVEHSSASIIIADRDGVIEYVNPAFCQITGYSEAEAMGRRPAMLVKSGLTPLQIYQELWNTILSGESWRGELRNRRKDGSLYWESVSISPIRDADGSITHFVSVRDDVTRRRELEEKLVRSATTDALTGLANRCHFFEQAEVELHRARRHGRPLAAVMMDVDHFKRINDTRGHAVGDRVLVAVAQACRDTLRSCDVLGRLGGEEFAAILPETNAAAALAAAERIRAAVAALAVPVEGGAPVAVTASFGCAMLLDGDGSIDSLLARADFALYRSKQEGRNRVTGAAG